MTDETQMHKQLTRLRWLATMTSVIVLVMLVFHILPDSPSFIIQGFVPESRSPSNGVRAVVRNGEVSVEASNFVGEWTTVNQRLEFRISGIQFGTSDSWKLFCAPSGLCVFYLE